LTHLKHILQQNKWFLLPFVLFVFTGIWFLLVYPKYEGFLFLNGIHNPTFDTFFKYITHLGDGIFILVASILLLFVKIRWGLVVLSSFVLSGGITQLLKNFVFDDVFRPALAIGAEHFHAVEGVYLNQYLSFPSGHATAAFTFFFALAILNANKTLGILYFAIAFISAYSRIYLGQHFPEDVLVGALIAITSTLLVFVYLEPKMGKWSDRSLVR